MRLSNRLFKLAAPKDADYLVSLNLKDLSGKRKRGPDEDPRTFYEALREEAKKGNLFSERTLKAVHDIPGELQKNEVQWLANNLEKGEKLPRDLPSILDYLRSENPNLSTLTFQQAERDSATWHRSFVKEVPLGDYTTKNVIAEFDGGYTMVSVPAEDLGVEGNFMGHCVGGNNYEKKVRSGQCVIYSLRDKNNHPHVTIEVTGQGPRRRIVQVQGKQNETPVVKYHGMLEKFFENVGLQDDPIAIQYLSNQEKLLKHLKNRGTREHALKNRNLPEAVMVREFAKGDEDTLLALLENPSLPARLLSSLFAKVIPEKGKLLSPVLPEVDEDTIPGVIELLLGHPNLPEDLAVKGLQRVASAWKELRYNEAENVVNRIVGKTDSKKVLSTATDLTEQGAFKPETLQMIELILGNKNLSSPDAARIVAKGIRLKDSRRFRPTSGFLLRVLDSPATDTAMCDATVARLLQASSAKEPREAYDVESQKGTLDHILKSKKVSPEMKAKAEKALTLTKKQESELEKWRQYMEREDDDEDYDDYDGEEIDDSDDPPAPPPQRGRRR